MTRRASTSNISCSVGLHFHSNASGSCACAATTASASSSDNSNSDPGISGSPSFIVTRATSASAGIVIGNRRRRALHAVDGIVVVVLWLFVHLCFSSPWILGRSHNLGLKRAIIVNALHLRLRLVAGLHPDRLGDALLYRWRLAQPWRRTIMRPCPRLTTRRCGPCRCRRRCHRCRKLAYRRRDEDSATTRTAASEIRAARNRSARVVASDRRGSDRRLLERRRSEQGEHTADDVGMVVVAVLRMLDGILAGTMRPALQ